ncbi:hypothetical protein [Chitinophaga solisilvae]|uniref:DUF4397 domain-containing protein n=1 Tax=Chitinophaga solisilvae TaxID=1233460 RepID=A0A9Q5GMJ9_9BACT|nr:hypothetical protein [Chitinophaga solisilvae]NSL88655.1 hypothetical protein [Chitinophaga solisilvae]
MKSMIHYIKIPLLSVLLLLTFTACNKEDEFREKAIQVVINGYNGGADELEVNIDTTRYDKTALGGKFLMKPSAMAGFNVVYTYRAAQLNADVTIKEPASGKVIFTKPLPATGTLAYYNFVYLDGKILDVPAPAANPAVSKLIFYVHHTASDAPFDMFLYRMDNTTGQEFREYLAKNVKPGTWINVDYTPSAAFNSKNILSGASIYFTKSGTVDQWAFEETEGRSKFSTFGLSFPIEGDAGLVQAYFIAQGRFDLERIRLFHNPDRLW